MASIAPCKACGQPIGSGARSCPHCGQPYQATYLERAHRAQWGFLVVFLLILAGIGAIAVIGGR